MLVDVDREANPIISGPCGHFEMGHLLYRPDKHWMTLSVVNGAGEMPTEAVRLGYCRCVCGVDSFSDVPCTRAYTLGTLICGAPEGHVQLTNVKKKNTIFM